MTASSPCTLGMIDTRKSIVLPRTRSLKRPSCGTRFSAMSSSAMTLMREMIVLWCRLSIGFIAGCSTPSMRYFTLHRVVLRLDVDVRGAALQRGEHHRVDQPDDRARVRGQLVDRQVLFARLVLARGSASGSLRWLPRARAVELSLFFRIDWIADGVPTQTRIGVAELDADLVDRLQVAAGRTRRSAASGRRAGTARSRTAASGRPECCGTARGRCGSARDRRTPAGSAAASRRASTSSAA